MSGLAGPRSGGPSGHAARPVPDDVDPTAQMSAAERAAMAWSSLLFPMPAARIVHQGPTQRCAGVGTATGAGQEKLVRQATLSHENPSSAARRHRFNAASLGSSTFITSVP